jgi:hypothetical protein
MYHKARHIDTRVYRLRELCKDGTMHLDKISTHDQVADALTKGLPRDAFCRHRNIMLGTPEAGIVSSMEDIGEQEAYDRMYQDPNVYPQENVLEYEDKMRVENITSGPSGGKRKREAYEYPSVHWQDSQDSTDRVQWARWFEKNGRLGASGIAGANGE